MATSIERMQTASEAILGRALTNEQLDRTATRFINHWPDEVEALIPDGQVEPPTNSQKASFFLRKVSDFVQDILRVEGKKEAAEPVIPDIEDSGDQAADDYEPVAPAKKAKKA